MSSIHSCSANPFSGLNNQNSQIHPEGTNLYLKLCHLHRGKNKVTVVPKAGVNNEETDMGHRESHHERKGHPSFTGLVYLNSVFVQPSFRVCIRRFWSTPQKYLFWFEMPGVAPGGSLVLWEEIISARRSSSLRAPLTGKSPHIPQASQIPISKLLQIFSRDHIQVTHIILLLTLKGSFLHGLWSVLLQMPQEGRVK